MKMLLSEKEEDVVWEKIYRRFHFVPAADGNVVPFQLPKPWVVYDVSDLYVEMADSKKLEQLTNAVNRLLLSCIVPGERLYALDWQHSGFLYDPRSREEQKSLFVQDDRYLGGGYTAYFPSYVPDGDYYFFLTQDLRLGYLGHPWRREVWIFGERFVDSFQTVVKQEPIFNSFRLKETS